MYLSGGQSLTGAGDLSDGVVYIPLSGQCVHTVVERGRHRLSHLVQTRLVLRILGVVHGILGFLQKLCGLIDDITRTVDHLPFDLNVLRGCGNTTCGFGQYTKGIGGVSGSHTDIILIALKRT